jgi:hypothetical protein
MVRALPRVALLAACVAGAGACSSPLPDGWRYSTRVGPTAATIVWTSHTAGRVVCRGGDGAHAADAPPSSIGLRVARLDGLRPATAYRCSFDGDRVPLRFRTAPAGDAAFRFAVVGDSGDASPTAKALARRILAGRPAFLVHLGDMTYHGETATGYARGLFRPYRRVLDRVPIFPTPGNHDLTRRSIYRALFAPVADVDDRDGPRYAFTWGAARLLSVTSMGLARGGAAAAWLADTLAAAPPDDWRVVFTHEPPFLPGRKWVTQGLRAAMTAVLDGAAPPDLLLAGHGHFYARAVPYCTGVATRPTVELISGGGGANLDPAAAQPNFPVWTSATHYLRVSVGRDAIVVRAVAVDGRVLDRVRLRRGAAAPCRRDGWPPPNEKAR